MAKPQLLQKLTHDKLLTKTNFPQFVETYNYTVNRCENIKGDGDEYGQGLIQVDNTDPEHPIIRVNYDNLKSDYLEQTTPDSDISDEVYEKFYEVQGLSSIQTRWENPGEDNELKSLQLYQFDLSNNTLTLDLSDQYANQQAETSGFDFIIRKDNQVQYMKLSSNVNISVDTDVDGNQKSIQWKTSSDDKYLQLYNMDLSGENVASVQLSTDAKNVLPNNYEFVVRKGGAGGEISYTTLQMACLSGGGGGGSGDITLSGTDNSSHKGSEFRFVSAANSNISVSIDPNGQIVFGCYYI